MLSLLPRLLTVPGPTARRPVLPRLTGLRFFAAALVVAYHTFPGHLPGADSSARHLVDAGFVGVSLFFVLSGFLLAYTYLDADGERLRGSARAFYRARVARVYPVYALALAVALPLFVGHVLRRLGSAADVRAGVLAGVLAPVLLQGWWPEAACQWNCPGWSLSVEAFFYAVFPLVGPWLARRRTGVAWGIALGTWGAALALALGYARVYPGATPHASPTDARAALWLAALKYHPVAHLGEFLLGIATGLAFLARRPATPARPRLLGAVAAAGGLGALVLLASGRVPYPVLHAGFLAPMFAGWIYALAAARGRATGWLAAPAVVALGEASYALYLLHVPLGGYVYQASAALGGLGGESWVVVGVYLAGCIAAALLVFRTFEEPARRWIRARGLPDARAPRRPAGSSADIAA